jgi:ribonucleotide monophosphatase NagD (HAD superfamily)
MRTHNAQPHEVVVVGDIYELDLALPQHLGMHIGLLVRDGTPEWERMIVQSADNGFTATTLQSARAAIEYLHVEGHMPGFAYK